MPIDARRRTRVCFAVAVLSAVCAFHAAVQAASPEPDSVSLSESTITWSTVKYATTAENGFVDGSLDKSTIVDRTFKTHVLENRYLKVTLVPEFGGRILSIIYKPTGHEQLYRTEVGVPYGMKGGTFYYDWLMVYGGIFPTFPDAEHGRTWLKPWDFEVVKQSAGEVTVAMSLEGQFCVCRGAEAVRGIDRHQGDLLCHAESRPRRARCARGAEQSARQDDCLRVLDLHDARAGIGPEQSQNDRRRRNHRADPGLHHAHWSSIFLAGDASAGDGKNRFEKLRYFKNWPTMGIAYAAPDMQGGNFWGVINHDNEEGIFRIADNRVTRGPENVDVGISLVHQRNRRAQGSEPAAALRRIVGGRVGPVFPQRKLSRAR